MLPPWQSWILFTHVFTYNAAFCFVDKFGIRDHNVIFPFLRQMIQIFLFENCGVTCIHHWILIMFNTLHYLQWKVFSIFWEKLLMFKDQRFKSTVNGYLSCRAPWTSLSGSFLLSSKNTQKPSTMNDSRALYELNIRIK